MINCTRFVIYTSPYYLVSYKTTEQSDRHANTQLAFEIAAEHLGIPVRSIFHLICIVLTADRFAYHTAIARG